METIKNYLDNMFLNYSQTSKVLRAKEELLSMMEDKYHELINQGKTENEAIGSVISEFGNLEELSESLGMSAGIEEEKEKREGWHLTFSYAREYIEKTKKQGVHIGIGVMFCILSPAILIILSGASETVGIGLHENIANGIGLVILLVMVAVGVAFFILTGIAYEKYENLEKEVFWIDEVTEQMVREEQQDFQSGFAISITAGVVLCVLSVIPIAVSGIFLEASNFVECLCVGFLLFMVSVGVFLFITAGTRHSSYQVLLQEGEYTKKQKKTNKVMETISSVYWCLITGIYLLWSFSKMNWTISWIIWPVAGVFFGAIAAIINAVTGEKS